VEVTNARIITNEKTYVLKNVTSVQKKVIEGPEYAAVGMIIATIGLFVAIIGVYGYFINGYMSDSGTVCAILGIPFLVGGLLFALQKQNTKWGLKITSSSTEEQALESPDEQYIQRIVAAINEAIVRNKG
jgi:hypothetical protein